MMSERGLNPDDFGWASIQLDGGIDAVMRKIVAWFSDKLRADVPAQLRSAGIEALRVGVVTQGSAPDHIARGLAELCSIIVAGGGTVVVSDKDDLLESPFSAALDLPESCEATLGYGQKANEAGFHVMANPRRHWGETLAGLGASGVELMLGYVEAYPLAGHPLVPVLQVSDSAAAADDLDALLSAGDDVAGDLLKLLVVTMAGDYIPRHQLTGTDDFQVTRGLLGISF